MTVKEYLVGVTLGLTVDRMNRLKQMEAPNVMITSLQEEINRLNRGEFICGGNMNLLDSTYKNSEVKKGRGGKQYMVINDGEIKYFPYAAYGRYIV